MREHSRGAPPPLPPLPSSVDEATCGLKLHRVVNGFCSLCFDPLEAGVSLSTGERLCTVCTSLSFDHGEQHELASPSLLTPRVALLATLDSSRHICPDELHELRGAQHQRALALLQSVRVGDTLRFCGCIASECVRSKLAVVEGFCVRRHLLLLRVCGAIFCMRMRSSEDALMVRELHDDTVALHERMLRQLTPVASHRTLQAMVATVQAAHTLCGSPLLVQAEAVLRRLNQAEEAERVGTAQPPLVLSRSNLHSPLLQRRPLSEKQGLTKPEFGERSMYSTVSAV